MFPFKKKEKKLYTAEYDKTSIEEVFSMFNTKPDLIVKYEAGCNKSMIISSTTDIRGVLRSLVRELYKYTQYYKDAYAANMAMVDIIELCQGMRGNSYEREYKFAQKSFYSPIIDEDFDEIDDCGNRLTPVVLVKDKENNLYLIPKEAEHEFNYLLENDPDLIINRFMLYSFDDINKVNLYFRPIF